MSDTLDNKTTPPPAGGHKKYVDYSHVATERELQELCKVEKHHMPEVFPLVLHEMLDYIETDDSGLEHVISWQPHGRAFMIRDRTKLVNVVFPVFFPQLKKYESFRRALSMWGYRRITQGSDEGAYYNEFFLRGKRFLCHGMKRTKCKGIPRGTWRPSPETEPDLFSLPFLPAVSKSRREDNRRIIPSPSVSSAGGKDARDSISTAASASKEHFQHLLSSNTQPHATQELSPLARLSLAQQLVGPVPAPTASPLLSPLLGLGSVPALSTVELLALRSAAAQRQAYADLLAGPRVVDPRLDLLQRYSSLGQTAAMASNRAAFLRNQILAPQTTALNGNWMLASS